MGNDPVDAEPGFRHRLGIGQAGQHHGAAGQRFGDGRRDPKTVLGKTGALIGIDVIADDVAGLIPWSRPAIPDPICPIPMTATFSDILFSRFIVAGLVLGH